MRRFAVMLALAALPAVAGCHEKQDPVVEPAGPPPLPPASGSVVGYLIDAQADLELRPEQLEKLKQIDSSLAARNGDIDTQLRQIEQPVPAEELTPQQIKAGVQEKRYDNAPGKSNIQTADSQRLHKIRDDNDRDALKKAFAVLDPPQLEKAKRILEDRGVDVPGAKSSQATTTSDDGTPLPGMDQ